MDTMKLVIPVREEVSLILNLSADDIRYLHNLIVEEEDSRLRVAQMPQVFI